MGRPVYDWCVQLYLFLSIFYTFYIVFDIFHCYAQKRSYCQGDGGLKSILTFLSFSFMSNTTGWNSAKSPEPLKCFTDGYRSSLPYFSSDLLHTYWQGYKPKMFNLDSMRPVAIDFESSSCMILHTSPISPCFPSFRVLLNITLKQWGFVEHFEHFNLSRPVLGFG